MINRSPSTLSKIVSYGIAGLALLFFLFPILWMVMTSFKQKIDAFTDVPKIVFTPTLDNYKEVLIERNFLTYLGHSLFVGLVATLFALALAVAIAYPLARYPIKGKGKITSWILSLRMMPPIVTLVPLYIIFSNLKLVDKFPSLILMYTFMTVPLAVWMIYGFFKDLPVELEEAALVDGASRLGAFFRVALPLIVPGLIATGMLAFIFCWNEFLFANVLTAARTRTAAVGLTEYSTPVSVFWTQIMAAGTIVVLPVLVIAMFIQKHMVRGLTMGAVKG
jgi:multiple sugar transport system permease protein